MGTAQTQSDFIPVAPPAVPRLSLDLPPTAGLEDRQRLLKGRLAGMWDLATDDPDPKRPFEATAWNLGELMIVSGEFPGRTMRRTAAMLRADQIDHYALALPLEGEVITARSDVRSATVRAGEPLMTDLSQGLRTQAHGGRFLLTLIPREALDDLLPRPLDLHVSPLRGGSAKMLASQLRAFADVLPTLGADEAKGVADSTLHLLVASLTHCPDISAISRKGAETTQLRQACRYVELHLREANLGAQDIGAALRLSRATVYRMFERFGGVSRYIKERRLIRVHGELAGRGTKSISLIADEFGYSSAAQFSQAFREQFGYSPRDVGRAESAPLFTGGETQSESYTDWVHRLRG